MLGVSSKVDYAIVVLAELANSDRKQYKSLQKIADKRKMSANYLAQIVMPLTKAQIIDSKEGKGGGHRLKKELEEISLAEIIRIFEGDMAFVPCMSDKVECQSSPVCVTKGVWQKVQKDFAEYAQGKSLKELLK